MNNTIYQTAGNNTSTPQACFWLPASWLARVHLYQNQERKNVFWAPLKICNKLDMTQLMGDWVLLRYLISKIGRKAECQNVNLLLGESCVRAQPNVQLVSFKPTINPDGQTRTLVTANFQFTSSLPIPHKSGSEFSSRLILQIARAMMLRNGHGSGFVSRLKFSNKPCQKARTECSTRLQDYIVFTEQ